MVSRVATTRPRFHQGSVRSVRSLICARVLVGASESCVIQRPRCALIVIVTATRSQATLMRAGAGRACDAHELIPVSLRMPHQGALPGCEPGYTPCFLLHNAAAGEQAHTDHPERWPAPPPAHRATRA